MLNMVFERVVFSFLLIWAKERLYISSTSAAGGNFLLSPQKYYKDMQFKTDMPHKLGYFNVIRGVRL